MSGEGPDPSTATPEPSTGLGTEQDTGRYLYAVCRGLSPDALHGVRGIAGEPLELVEHRDLVAVVSTVPLESFGEEALRRNLEDLTWLESVVRAHDDVVHAVAAHGATAPMRLATICFDDTAVRARLRQWAVDLDYVLDRVAGCAEWSVKLLQLGPQADPAEETAAPASGAEYLRRRKAAVEQRAASAASAADVAELVHATLAARARASRQLPPQDPRLSGLSGTMVLNAAYLVPDDDAADFNDVLDELRARYPDLTIDARGPWPPYSFAMLEQS
jgi:Gas vesicle synthesis protein GvpL/GvpF